MVRPRKVAGWLLVLGIVLGAAAAGLWFILRDEPPPADGDLRSFRRAVPDEANGFPVLDFPAEEVFWPDEAGARLERIEDEFDIDLAAEVVRRNEGVFRKVDESLARPEFQIPQEEGPESEVGYLIAWRQLAYALSVRCRLRHEEGRDPEALDDALRLLRLGHRIQGGQAALIDYLVGIAIHSIGSSFLLHLAPRARLERFEIQEAIARSSTLSPDPRFLADTYRVEYAIMSSVFERLGAGDATCLAEDLPSGRWAFRTPLFRTNRTRRFLAEDLRLLIAAAAKPAVERSLLDLDAKYAVSGKTKRSLLSLGKVVLAKLVPVYLPPLHKQDIAQAYLGAARLMLALRLHHDDHGDLPDALADLVPAYLDAVPADPFDGKALRYSREKRIVYSVGDDFADAGGSAEEDGEKARFDLVEPTFRIEIE
jgi:hypothetical protein